MKYKYPSATNVPSSLFFAWVKYCTGTVPETYSNYLTTALYHAVDSLMKRKDPHPSILGGNWVLFWEKVPHVPRVLYVVPYATKNWNGTVPLSTILPVRCAYTYAILVLNFHALICSTGICFDLHCHILYGTFSVCLALPPDHDFCCPIC